MSIATPVMSANTKPIREMFDALVPEYDRFNHISSLGMDFLWRRDVARMFESGMNVLDVGTGTGDLAKELHDREINVTGVDFSQNMLDAAREKFKRYPTMNFEYATADELPYEPRSFDGITSAFVIRNLHHAGILSRSFREFFRVLKPGSQMVHLELSRPPSGILAWGHRTYLKFILPIIGKANFGSRWPKDYLNETISKFPAPQTVCQQMRWAGFEQVCHYPLSSGIAGMYVGRRC